MSTPGNGGGDKKEGLSKLIRRATKVLKPSSRSNRNSVSGLPEAGPSAVTSKPVSSSALAAVDTPADVPVDTPVAPAETHHGTTARPVSKSALEHVKAREEKARALFAKYGFTLEPGEWTAPATGNSQWVEKKVVMRVHRQCHRCQTSFGADKTCSNCTHTRCKKCPRFPTKRSPEEKARHEKERAERAAVAIDVDHLKPGAKVKPIQLVMPNRRTGVDEVRRNPVQRVRRTCHKCETLFIGKALNCESCKHARCPQCPREPPKLKKWGDGKGYPGDVEETFPLAERTFRKPRTRFRWECHECNKAFIEHEKICRGCEHQRCDDCPRKPPKKVKPEHDPEVIKSLEEKMAQSSLSPAPAPAAAA